MSFSCSSEKTPTVETEQETRFQWTCVIEADKLIQRGTSDAYLEARWGMVTMRVRLGSRSTAHDQAAIALGVPARAVFLFTSYDNLSLDVGVKRTYKSLSYTNRVVKLVPTKKSTVVVLEGPIEASTRLGVEQARRGRSTTRSAVIESLNPVTHVAELPLQMRPGTYQFALEGPSGRTVLAPGAHVGPPALRVQNRPDGKVDVAKRRRWTAWTLLSRARSRLVANVSRRRTASE